VASDLVPGIGDGADNAREARGDPAKSKECCGRAGFGEQIENALGVGLHTAGQGVPASPAHVPCKSADVEIVLDIESQGVSHLGYYTSRGDERNGHSRVLLAKVATMIVRAASGAVRRANLNSLY